MKINFRKCLALIAGTVMLLAVICFIDYIYDFGFLRIPQKRYAKAEMISRMRCLDRLRVALKEYLESNPNNEPDLYKAYCFKEAFPLVIIPPKQISYSIEDIATDTKLFYETCEYRIIKTDNNSWGIIELYSGYDWKGFLAITDDGAIYNFPVTDQDYAEIISDDKNIKPLPFCDLKSVPLKKLRCSTGYKTRSQ